MSKYDIKYVSGSDDTFTISGLIAAVYDLDKRIQHHEDEVKEPVKKIKELEDRIEKLETTIRTLIPAINSLEEVMDE